MFLGNGYVVEKSADVSSTTENNNNVHYLPVKIKEGRKGTLIA